MIKMGTPLTASRWCAECQSDSHNYPDCPTDKDTWLIDTDQMNRIEEKLDRLLAIWEEYEPLIHKAAEFQNMTAAQKVKALMNRGTT